MAKIGYRPHICRACIAILTGGLPNTMKYIVVARICIMMCTVPGSVDLPIVIATMQGHSLKGAVTITATPTVVTTNITAAAASNTTTGADMTGTKAVVKTATVSQVRVGTRVLTANLRNRKTIATTSQARAVIRMDITSLHNQPSNKVAITGQARVATMAI